MYNGDYEFSLFVIIFLLQAAQMAGDSKKFLLYYYYGGMIYAALKKFQRAEYFFEVVSFGSDVNETDVTLWMPVMIPLFQVTCVPATVVSAIMVEAFKKLILMRLILRRPETGLSKFAPMTVSRYIKVCLQ